MYSADPVTIVAPVALILIFASSILFCCLYIHFKFRRRYKRASHGPTNPAADDTDVAPDSPSPSSSNDRVFIAPLSDRAQALNAAVEESRRNYGPAGVRVPVFFDVRAELRRSFGRLRSFKSASGRYRQFNNIGERVRVTTPASVIAGQRVVPCSMPPSRTLHTDSVQLNVAKFRSGVGGSGSYSGGGYGHPGEAAVVSGGYFQAGSDYGPVERRYFGDGSNGYDVSHGHDHDDGTYESVI